MRRFLCFIYLFIELSISTISQTKSKKLPPQRVVKKPIASPKKATINTQKPQIVQPQKTASKVDTIISKPVEKPKLVQKPITGPINDGPNTMGNSKPNEATIKKPVSEKALKSKKPSKSVLSNWIKNNLTLGLKSGMNISSIENFSTMVYSGVEIPESKPLTGYNGGLVLLFKSNSKLQFNPEISFSQIGAQIVEPMNKFKFRLNYLNLPLPLKYNFGSKKLSYSISAGPYFAYALSRKSFREIGGKIYEEKIPFYKNFNAFGEKDNRIDFGPIFGIGVQYKINKILISLDAKGQIGLANPIIYKTEISKNSNNTGKNRSASTALSLFYLF